jgi:hypothetical protein
LWSCVALEIARKAGINVPPHRTERRTHYATDDINLSGG